MSRAKIVILPLIVFFLMACSNLYSNEAVIDNENFIGLQNKSLSVVFNKQSGQLVSVTNKNTNDNYIKTPNGGNIFRFFVNAKAMPRLKAGSQHNDYGGVIIDPSTCKLDTFEIIKKEVSNVLVLNYLFENLNVQIKLQLELFNDANNFDAHIAVTNAGKESFSGYLAFPYLTGICIGEDKSANLAVNMWDRGYPGAKAWERPLGGVYGKDVSMQWQTVYETEGKQGLAFITMDKDFSNKVLSTFPEGGMSSLYFDQKVIEPSKTNAWPSARFLVYNGNWRTAAKAYNNWFDNNVQTRNIPEWYKEEISTRSSTWFPTKETVAENKQDFNSNSFTSFQQLHSLFSNPIFGNDINDCMEIAMWNEGVNIWPDTYGPWMSSGFIDYRSDLGGEEAFKKGVEICHAYGRRVGMYVAAYGARTTSPIFEGNWEQFAIKNRNGKPVMDYRKGKEIYGAFNCPGYKPWQDNLIRICTMLAEAGVDEIRLDEFGFPFRPCFNEAHEHKSPFNANTWMRECLKRIREATDKINPELFLSTEFYMDYFNESTNGALIMDCPGNEIDAMKVAMPNYVPLSYHASSSEAAITGAIMSKTESRRNNWAWGNVGVEKPDDYNEDFVVNLRWHELHPTFSEAVTYGDVTEWDPIAENDPKWMGHVWKSKDYWVLTGGHIDATPLPTAEVRVKLPELPEAINNAYEFNVETLEMREVPILRKDEEVYISLQSAVSAVLFPFESCEPLPIIVQKGEIDKGNESLVIEVSLFAPWNNEKTSYNLDNIYLNAPGFEVSNKVVDKVKTFIIHKGDTIPKGNYHYSVLGDCMKVKRWFEVVK
ncbi:DUF6259 domain-containing protein [Aestuariivivens sp. NBU2969]|uniref:DUF6259 domain-containing protein n=1 Tax=Aestuariivivens sp. NBU2969 TaxID=2873267 RepID=UPI001CC1142E|nr:DUF6259 domain-containing protein [Aestuariivivens sp. NBU2969]